MVKLGLVFLTVGILGAAANYAAAKAFPLQWGGPNIGGGMLQLVFFAGIVAGIAVIVPGSHQGTAVEGHPAPGLSDLTSTSSGNGPARIGSLNCRRSCSALSTIVTLRTTRAGIGARSCREQCTAANGQHATW